jgi:signal transduction histidine kinase
MPRPPRRYLFVVSIGAAALAIVILAFFEAATWYERPFAGILVDPEGTVSSLGLPSWDGFHQGLRFPDQILEVDGQPLALPGGRGVRGLGRAVAREGLAGALRHPATAWDRAVDRAAAEGRAEVRVRARTAAGERELSLRISRLEPIAWWLNAGGMFLIGVLYALAAILALSASPKGRLARTFAKTALLAGLFLCTLFDYHTTRIMVPLFHLAFAMVPMSFFALALRLPDDVPLLERRPWIVAALDAVGLGLGLAMIGAHATGHATADLRLVCTALFGASFFFFAVTFLLRFARARGDRRATMRSLLLSMVPVHVIIGAAFALAALHLGGANIAFCSVPALALTPLSTVAAFIRHDLWGSRALLSRVLARLAIGGLACGVSVAIGTAIAASLHVPMGGAFLASAVAALVACVVLEPALRVGDRAFFPSRAVYKPTIEQLSEELTLITDPDEVGDAVERTVRRWLPCERVRFVPLGGGIAEPAAPAPEIAAPLRPMSAAEAHRLDSGIRSIPPPEAEEAPDESGAHENGRSIAAKGPSSFAVEHAPAPGNDAAPRDDEAAARDDEMSIDVLFRGRPLAVLHVGPKRGGALFTSEDVDLLRTIGNQAALALASAGAYAELELRRRQQAHAFLRSREALVETVAAEIAHEIRYPINFFRSIFRRTVTELKLDAEEVDIGCEEVERLERLVSGLRRVAVGRLERRSVAVAEIAVKAERLLRDQLGARSLALDVAAAPWVRCDPDQVTQILVNLLSNALDAAGAEGEVGVAWGAGAEQGSGTITVWDSGPGFKDDPQRLFAPWYTTKPRGTGLGLAITHRMVRAHGWTIDPERRSGRTLFVITIPAGDILAAHPAPEKRSAGEVA